MTFVNFHGEFKPTGFRFYIINITGNYSRYSDPIPSMDLSLIGCSLNVTYLSSIDQWVITEVFTSVSECMLLATVCKHAVGNRVARGWGGGYGSFRSEVVESLSDLRMS